MTLAVLGVGYVAIGGALAVITWLARRIGLADAVLVVGMWPLYAPFLWLGRAGDAREDELLDALARAAASPLAAVLPDRESARVLARQLREANARLVELDALLARPDFDPRAVEQHAVELLARGAVGAAATAQLRVRTLGQLAALRRRYRSELDEVSELIAQLVTQAELVRLEPSASHASGELVRELVTRVEGLGELFAYQAAIDRGELPEYQPGAGRWPLA